MTQHKKIVGKIITKPEPTLSPGQKARKTARWARTMTKWLITYTRHRSVKWNLVEFGGKTGSESKGIVDMVAIRKDFKSHKDGLKQGDLLDIILIQVKGGSANRPSDSDVKRLVKVAEYHRAKTVILAEWKKGQLPIFYRLSNMIWQEVDPIVVFG